MQAETPVPYPVVFVGGRNEQNKRLYHRQDSDAADRIYAAGVLCHVPAVDVRRSGFADCRPVRPVTGRVSCFNWISNDDDHLSQTESKYDYTKINNLLKNNTVESFNKGKVDESLGDVLLTGATGFLGVHVLKELIESEQGKIYCLLRSKKDLHAADRLKTLLFYYFSESFEDMFDDRIVVVEGDITNYDDFEKMINYNINTIINCAANVKHFSSGKD